MNGRIPTCAAVVLVFVFGAAPAVQSQSFTSAHWKSKMEMEGRRQGTQVPAEYEMWFKDGKMRTKGRSAGQSMNILKIGDDLYMWSDGQSVGMKMNASMARHQNGPSQDYVRRIEEFKTKGKKVGSETVDGHPCDIYDYAAEPGNSGRYWLARDLHDFPIQAILEQNGTKITYHNVEIQVPASVPDSMLEPPRDVQFQDLSEMMKGMREKEK